MAGALFSVSPLTGRAIVGTALCNDNAADRPPAPYARQSFAPIDAMPLLKTASPSLGIHVIRYGRTAKLDRLGQHLTNCIDQFCSPGRAEPVGPPSRVNACAKQSLVGIDVSDAAEHRLIEQHRFDRG